MLGIDTYREFLALIGCVFLAWFLIVTLFAPHIPYRLHERLDCASPHFIHTLNNVMLSSVHHDSRFEVLTNAEEFYPAMLEAIAGARHSINMECYIFRPDATGRTVHACDDRAGPRRSRRDAGRGRDRKFSVRSVGHPRRCERPAAGSSCISD